VVRDESANRRRRGHLIRATATRASGSVPAAGLVGIEPGPQNLQGSHLSSAKSQPIPVKFAPSRSPDDRAHENGFSWAAAGRPRDPIDGQSWDGSGPLKVVWLPGFH
jgi:hypothetical protein